MLLWRFDALGPRVVQRTGLLDLDEGKPRRRRLGPAVARAWSHLLVFSIAEGPAQ
ncbi:hypothetical protein QY702_14280 [Xanthomonas campestris pv. plantaginis]|nr:hypothetical protein [Xanthomonas campestris]MEA9607578.1 hypothetical protein [Xanthomonas campestris pv. plantaginis]